MVRGRGSVPRPGPPKTQPLQFEEFASLIEWWNRREENERAWKVGGWRARLMKNIEALIAEGGEITVGALAGFA